MVKGSRNKGLSDPYLCDGGVGPPDFAPAVGGRAALPHAVGSSGPRGFPVDRPPWRLHEDRTKSGRKVKRLAGTLFSAGELRESGDQDSSRIVAVPFQRIREPRGRSRRRQGTRSKNKKAASRRPLKPVA